MPDFIHAEQDRHDAAEELLPWYATGQLGSADRLIVEGHLSSCAECRRQLDIERRLVEQFRTLDPQVDSGWKRLCSRIEMRRSPVRRALHGGAGIWAVLSRPAVVTLAAAQLAILVIGGGLMLSFSRPDYHALGSAPAPMSANVLVMFQPGTTEQQLRDVLRGSSASLVGGPTSSDAYLLHVAPRARPAALSRLRSDRRVELAQPIDGGATQ